MKSRALHKAVVLVTLVGLVACQPSGELRSTSNGPTASSLLPPTSVFTATPTVTPTSKPSPTSTMTRTPYPPTPVSQAIPNIFDSPIANDLLFSGDKACTLPCWYGLRIGKSSVVDIQAALRQALGVPKDYVFMMGQSDIFSGNFVRFYWERSRSQNESPEYFSVVTNFDLDTDLLTTVRVTTTHSYFLQRTTPQNVLRAIGIPSAIWVLFSPTEVADVASLELDFLYFESDQWIFMSWGNVIPVQFTTTPRVARWCLNGGSSQGDQNFLLRIPPDFDPETTDMSKYGFLPLQEVFGITPEALYQRVMNEDNICLSHEF